MSFHSLLTLVVVAFAVLTMNISAMEDRPEWDMLLLSKEGMILEAERESKVCHELGQQMQDAFLPFKEELGLALEAMKCYEHEIDSCRCDAEQKRGVDSTLRLMAARHMSAIKQLLDKIQSIREIVQVQTKQLQVDKLRQAEKGQQSICEQIFGTHGIKLELLSSGRSTPLKKGTETIGWARSYPQGVVIELKGMSQECSMSCGAATYLNACILDTVHNYPQLLDSLRDHRLLEAYMQELRALFLKQAAEIWGPQNAQPEWERIMHAEGLSLDWLYEAAHNKKLCVCVDDARYFTMFPSAGAAERLAGDKKHGWLKYTFYPELKRFIPDAQVQLFTLPKTVLLLTGHDVQHAGHWIAVHFEKMAGGKVGIVFADSCPYAREAGRIVEAVDKIEAYHEVFASWFAVMSASLPK